MGEGLGEMDAADAVGFVEIGERPGDLEDAVVGTRRQTQPFHGLAEEPPPTGVEPHDLVDERGGNVGVGAEMSGPERGETRSLLDELSRHGAERAAGTARARATRAPTSREPSRGAGRRRSAAETAGTSMRMSMRSSSGPEMRAR